MTLGNPLPAENISAHACQEYIVLRRTQSTRRGRPFLIDNVDSFLMWKRKVYRLLGDFAVIRNDDPASLVANFSFLIRSASAMIL